MTKQEIHLKPTHVKAYRFIEGYIAKNLYSPNRLEVQKALKLSYRQTWVVVDQLIQWGYISSKHNTERSFKILKPLK